jgi:cytochrome c-type biogenesis protein CcmH
MRAAVLGALVAAVLVTTGSAAGAGGRPNASDLEAELVCPVCQTTLDQSDAPIAVEMKAYIRRRIAAGDSAAQIRAALVAQFGQGVLATPSKHGFGLLAWLVPILVVLGAGLVIGVLVWAWSKRRGPPGPERPLDPELERRVDEELARFEA